MLGKVWKSMLGEVWKSMLGDGCGIGWSSSRWRRVGNIKADDLNFRWRRSDVLGPGSVHVTLSPSCFVRLVLPSSMWGYSLNLHIRVSPPFPCCCFYYCFLLLLVQSLLPLLFFLLQPFWELRQRLEFFSGSSRSWYCWFCGTSCWRECLVSPVPSSPLISTPRRGLFKTSAAWLAGGAAFLPGHAFDALW